MKKYLLIGHKDANSPYALDTKMKLKHNDDNIDVIVINVPHYRYITDGLAYLQHRIETGAISVSEEVKNFVRKLNRLSGDTYAYLEATEEIVGKVRQELGYFWLQPNTCIFLKDRRPRRKK